MIKLPHSTWVPSKRPRSGKAHNLILPPQPSAVAESRYTYRCGGSSMIRIDISIIRGGRSPEAAERPAPAIMTMCWLDFTTSRNLFMSVLGPTDIVLWYSALRVRPMSMILELEEPQAGFVWLCHAKQTTEAPSVAILSTAADLERFREVLYLLIISRLA
jgi:hypothetical protein